MTSPSMAAGMILAGLSLEDPETLLADYARAGIRAFIFPGCLLDDPERLSGLAALARRLVAEAGSPACVAALGGWAHAATSYPNPPDLPNPLSIAAAGDRRLAKRTGFLLASKAAACGIDLVFGPRLDLASDPKSSSGVMDCFGDQPGRVALLGQHFAAGMEAGGVAACALSFPGCGSLVFDGRVGPRTLPSMRERLELAELLPFAKLAKAGLPALLVAQAFVPALEPGRIPAARSALVIEGKLRSSLGFRGLVIGEACDGFGEGQYNGIKPDYGRLALSGALAGCDLGACLRPSTAFEAAAALEAAAAEGILPAPRVSIAMKRISALVASLSGGRRGGGGRQGPVSPADLVASHARQASERSATFFRGAPSGKSGPADFVLLFLPPPSAPEAGAFPPTAARKLLAEEFGRAEIMLASDEPSDAEIARLMEALAAASGEGGGKGRAATVFSYDAHLSPKQESLIHLVEESFEEVAVIALHDPYDAAFFPRSHALGAVYGYSEAGLKTAILMATGRIEARGSCPVSVLGLEF